MAASMQPSVFSGIPSLKSNKPTNTNKQLLRKPRLRPRVDDTSKRSDKSSSYEPSLGHSRYSQFSPDPSVVPSLASPPPAETPCDATVDSYRQRTRTFITKNDRKFILDQNFIDRHRSALTPGFASQQQPLVKPYKPRGPDPLPLRSPKKYPQIDYNPNLFAEYDNEIRYIQPPEFTLQTFLREVSNVEKVPVEKVQEIMYSKHSYRKITKLLQEQIVPKQVEVGKISLDPDEAEIPDTQPRIPQKQLLIEMAAIVRDQMKAIMNTDVKTIIKPLPKYTSPFTYPDGPHTEILLYEDTTSEIKQKERVSRQETEVPATDAIFHAGTVRYFQGSRRSHSPFALKDEGLISPSELAILDSLINGGVALSLKAHFIADLPDITPLVKTITYLNLSFNDIRLFPQEILEIEQLQILKLRNNPIREIPHEICKLHKLRTFVVSFCCLSSVPISLFAIEKLRHLDISYNRLSFIPNEIRKAKHLRELILEGNQLPAMPCGALRLQLRYLRVKNNFMHPLFWKENTKNQPQRLTDLAALAFMNAGLDNRYRNLPDDIVKITKNHTICDCCHGPLFGNGLRLIRPASKIFGVRNLPFLFISCSPYCADIFMKSTDTLSDILYGSEESIQ